jgi:Lrp/AsnC family transcriptional regulator, leucine-responsive regulatory protein
MKFGSSDSLDLDTIDLQILQILQQDCKISLARIGELVGLSAPSVIERIKKLEQGGAIRGYHAALDSRCLGLDVTAFIGVVIDHPTAIEGFEDRVSSLEGVLECHHVTGHHTLLLKVKTGSTSTLEALIRQIRSVPGVTRTETMVVLSTHSEQIQISLRALAAQVAAEAEKDSPRRRSARPTKVVSIQPG